MQGVWWVGSAEVRMRVFADGPRGVDVGQTGDESLPVASSKGRESTAELVVVVSEGVVLVLKLGVEPSSVGEEPVS